MGTTAAIERQRALAWIVRQLDWERTLEALRVYNEVEERAAA